MKRYIQKIREKIKSRQGFTLIEMIITTALVAAFFTVVASILPAWSKNYAQAVTLSYARQISSSIFTAIETQILFANEVEESTNVPGSIEGKGPNGSFVIPQRNGDDIMIEGLVYDEKFYRNMKVDLEFQVNEGSDCTVIVIVYDENGNTILSRTRVMKLLGKSA